MAFKDTAFFTPRLRQLIRMVCCFAIGLTANLSTEGFSSPHASIPARHMLIGINQSLSRFSRLGFMSSSLYGQISQQDASKAIEKVVASLRQDRTANDELGRLEQVAVVLGYGSPSPGSIALRFNARFKRSGFGRSSVPMPFGLGQTSTPEGRGTMVGQVKAEVDTETGKVTSCSVFRDLGYGRSFNLKV
jgi:hypothetical protein